MAHPKVSESDVADAMVAAFRQGGYAGAAIRDLTDATGLKSASLYHRYPTKADMALAALAHAGDAFTDLVIRPLADVTSPMQCLAVSADGLVRFYDDGRLACLLAVFASSEAPEPVRDVVAMTFARWRDALAAVLSALGATQPTILAEDRIAAIQGGLLLARATGDRETFARAVKRMAEVP